MNLQNLVLGHNNLFNSVTVNGQVFERTENTISGVIKSDRPIDLNSFKVVLDDTGVYSSAVFDITQTSGSDGKNILDFSLKANRLLRVRTINRASRKLAYYDIPHKLTIYAEDDLGRASSFRQNFTLTRGSKFRVKVKQEYNRDPIPTISQHRQVFQMLADYLEDLLVNRTIAPDYTTLVDPEKYDMEYLGVDSDRNFIVKLKNYSGENDTIRLNDSLTKESYENINHNGLKKYRKLHGFGFTETTSSLDAYLNLGIPNLTSSFTFKDDILHFNEFREGDLDLLATSSFYMNSSFGYRTPVDSEKYYKATYHVNGETGFTEGIIYKVTLNCDSNSGSYITSIPLVNFLDPVELKIKSDDSGQYYNNCNLTIEQVPEIPDTVSTRNHVKVMQETLSESGTTTFTNGARNTGGFDFPLTRQDAFPNSPLEMFVNEFKMADYVPPSHVFNSGGGLFVSAGENRVQVDFINGNNGKEALQFKVTGLIPSTPAARLPSYLNDNSQEFKPDPLITSDKYYHHFPIHFSESKIPFSVRVKGFLIGDSSVKSTNYDHVAFGSLSTLYVPQLNLYDITQSQGTLSFKARVNGHHLNYFSDAENINEIYEVFVSGEKVDLQMVKANLNGDVDDVITFEGSVNPKSYSLEQYIRSR